MEIDSTDSCRPENVSLEYLNENVSYQNLTCDILLLLIELETIKDDFIFTHLRYFQVVFLTQSFRINMN